MRSVTYVKIRRLRWHISNDTRYRRYYGARPEPNPHRRSHRPSWAYCSTSSTLASPPTGPRNARWAFVASNAATPAEAPSLALARRGRPGPLLRRNPDRRCSRLVRSADSAWDDRGRQGQLNSDGSAVSPVPDLRGTRRRLSRTRYIVRSQKNKVLKVRARFMAERLADQKAHPTDSIGELKIAGPQPGDPPENHGELLKDHTTVLAYYGWTYTVRSTSGATLFMNGGGLPWKAEARKESDGWRIWSLEIPPWCGIEGQPKSGYARCNR